MVAFYNQGDQEIYDEGEHFIPQEYYRLNKFNNTVAPMPMDGTQQITQEFGIPYTGAFTNAGGAPAAPASPHPLNPSGFAGQGVGLLINSIDGIWLARGML